MVPRGIILSPVNTTTASTAPRSCRRCNGSGTVAHKHVLGGRCFGCGGSGLVSRIPRRPVAYRTVNVLRTQADDIQEMSEPGFWDVA